MEKMLREQIAECMTNGRRCLYKSSFKRKRDLQPICKSIKADFESLCPEQILTYRIYWDITNTIQIIITDRLTPGLQKFAHQVQCQPVE